MPFEEFITQHETVIRLSAFISIFAIMASLELIKPCRQLSVSKSQRWIANLGITVLNTLVLRLVFPIAATSMALWSANKGWGLFNILELPTLVEVALAIIVLDCVIYWQHVIFHYVPFFWAFHRMHHADLDYDVTTGARFHPIEIVLSMSIKLVTILLLGPSVAAVVLFEVILNGCAMFNHSNISLPAKLDRVLRLFLVTPDMHRVHHSVIEKETNSNFGFSLPWWDRLFGTYTPYPQHGNLGMTIGLNEYRDHQEADKLRGMLLIPFK
ncbi:sterol desaturase family protein [Aurantivibrio plasticivorans]